MERACAAIRSVEPSARVILYGSRARGTADYQALRFSEARVRPLLGDARRFIDAIERLTRSAEEGERSA